jgi:hypothetical protein
MATSSLALPQIERDLGDRPGDNTIYFTWDAESGKVVEATSSRQLRPKQSVELLTRLADRPDVVSMKGVLQNISDAQHLRIDGRLIHKVMQGDVVIKRVRSRLFHRVLDPGEKIAVRFTYKLPSGDYSARTDYAAE